MQDYIDEATITREHTRQDTYVRWVLFKIFFLSLFLPRSRAASRQIECSQEAKKSSCNVRSLSLWVLLLHRH